MATVVGLLLLGLLLVGLASHLLDAPERQRSAPFDPTEGPPCRSCGWPPWSVMPCLCPEDDRGPAFRGSEGPNLGS